MQPEERDPAYLWDALRAGRMLQEFVSGRTFDEYVKDRVLPSAVERQFEIFGEAARKVSNAFRKAHPEIPWTRIVGLRNILAHRYYATDHALLWKIIHGELARALEQIERLVPPLPQAGEER
jgi:uncharacterized protein with HEPN domain